MALVTSAAPILKQVTVRQLMDFGDGFVAWLGSGADISPSLRSQVGELSMLPMLNVKLVLKDGQTQGEQMTDMLVGTFCVCAGIGCCNCKVNRLQCE